MLETVRTFTALSEEFVEESLRLWPVEATAAGIHDYDHRLPDDTPDGLPRAQRVAARPRAAARGLGDVGGDAHRAARGLRPAALAHQRAARRARGDPRPRPRSRRLPAHRARRRGAAGDAALRAVRRAPGGDHRAADGDPGVPGRGGREPRAGARGLGRAGRSRSPTAARRSSTTSRTPCCAPFRTTPSASSTRACAPARVSSPSARRSSATSARARAGTSRWASAGWTSGSSASTCCR